MREIESSCWDLIFYLGGLLMMIGYFLTFFCQTLLQVYILIGIVAYCGGSFVYSVSYISIAEYMDNYLCIGMNGTVLEMSYFFLIPIFILVDLVEC